MFLWLQDLPEDLQIHHIIVNDWAAGVDAPQNVVLISIPSVLSPDIAPPGKHVLHAYLPGTEPYQVWAGLDRRSSAYRQLKEDRSQVDCWCHLPSLLQMDVLVSVVPTCGSAFDVCRCCGKQWSEHSGLHFLERCAR